MESEPEDTEFVFPRKESVETIIVNSGGKCLTESERDKSGVEVLDELTDSISPIPKASQITRQNSQRRLRIASEDHRLFLADINTDVLPYIEECKREMSNEDNEDLSMHSVNKDERHTLVVTANSESGMAMAECSSDDNVYPNEELEQQSKVFWDQTNNNNTSTETIKHPSIVDLNRQLPQEPTPRLHRKIIPVKPNINLKPDFDTKNCSVV